MVYILDLELYLIVTDPHLLIFIAELLTPQNYANLLEKFWAVVNLKKLDSFAYLWVTELLENLIFQRT